MSSPVETSYWGEIPQVADTESGIAALEREQITKPRPLDVEGSLLHQPSSRHHPPTNEPLNPKDFQMDPVVLHTIRLHQYMRNVQTAMSPTQQDVKQENSGSSDTAIGPIPVYDGPVLQDGHWQKHDANKDYQSNFARGIGVSPAPIDDITCKKLLRRSTAAICAHLSFETAQESALETLTDVCQEFFITFTKRLGHAADKRIELGGSDGFPDIIERVYHEMGLGSISSLHDFYQQRVLQYHSKIQKQCQALATDYNSICKQPAAVAKHSSSPSPNSGSTLHVIRIKEEPSTEIQFPLLDENDEVNETEQLLNIESLGAFEITVEHETSTGLTTEVETKWVHSGKGQGGESRIKHSSASTEDAVDSLSIPKTPQSNISQTPQGSIPASSQESNTPTPKECISHDDTSLQEPGSISSMDIFSPSAPTPTKPKKRKRN